MLASEEAATLLEYWQGRLGGAARRSARSSPGPIPEPSTPPWSSSRRDTLAPLYMVHPIGGEVYFYRDLAHYIGARQGVYAFQVRSLVGKTEPYDDIREQAAAYIEDLRKVRRQGPYLLGGASYGGLVAVEMASQLRRAGQQVPLVAMMDAPGPGHMPKKTEGHAEVLDYLLGDQLDLDFRP